MKAKAFILLVLLLNISTSHAFENFDQAFNQMRHRYSLGHYKRMIAIASDALELSKTPMQKYQILYYKGLAQEAMQDFWQAEQTFEEAAGIQKISSCQKTQARYKQIRSQYANQHFTSALANAEKYLTFSDKPSILHLNILLTGIESARQLGQNAKALVLAEKMTSITAPDSAWYYRGIIMKIQILCLTKEYEEAKQITEKINVAEVPLPMRAEFLAWSGFCYEKDNRHELAGKQYAQAYEKYSSYYSGLAALRHANLLSRSGKNNEQIVAKYEKVLKLAQAHSKHKSQALYKIAYIYQQKQKPEIAIRYLAQIDDLKNPSIYWQAKIYNLHGDIYYKEGKMAMAKKYFQACLSLSRHLPDSQLYASEILAQMEEKRVLPEKQ